MLIDVRVVVMQPVYVLLLFEVVPAIMTKSMTQTCFLVQLEIDKKLLLSTEATCFSGLHVMHPKRLDIFYEALHQWLMRTLVLRTEHGLTVADDTTLTNHIENQSIPTQ